MRVCELISRFRALCRAELDDTALVSLIDEVEGLVCTEVLLLDPSNLRRLDYPEDSERELTVSAPHDKLYLPYLTAMAHFWCGDYVSYENQSALFNSYFAEYQRYVARTLAPARGECEQRGYYLSAYSIAVKHGFEGSEAEWNEAVSAQLRQAEAAARLAQTHARSASNSAERAEAAIESVRAAGRELLDKMKVDGADIVSDAESKAAEASSAAEAAVSAMEQAQGLLASGVNRLRGYASGRVTTLPDVSDVSHAISVSVQGSDGESRLLCLGKNLFDPSVLLKVSSWSESDGVYSGIIPDLYAAYKTSGDALVSGCFEENTAYTLSLYACGDIGTNSVIFRSKYTDGTSDAIIYVASTEMKRYTATTRADKTLASIHISYDNGWTAYFSHIQLEKGNTASGYEPCRRAEYPVSTEMTLPSRYPVMTLALQGQGSMTIRYQRDINSAIAELKNAIISLGGNI